MGTWHVGRARITAVLETMLEVPAAIVIDAATPEALAPHRAWLEPAYVTADGRLRIAVQALLVESCGLRIVVDTCFGNDRDLPYPGLPPLQTDFLDRLAEHGFGPDDVDVVLCTHLHHDHVGWNTRLVDGTWVPTFPNATYLFGAAEYEHWQTHDDTNIDLTDSVEPVVAAGLHRFVATDHAVTDEISLVPTPGHTRGHVSVRISSDGATAYIGGDVLHRPVQVAEPAWPSVPDGDPAVAVRTRSALLARLADERSLLIGTHFAMPAAGHVRHDGDADSWRWEPVEARDDAREEVAAP